MRNPPPVTILNQRLLLAGGWFLLWMFGWFLASWEQATAAWQQAFGALLTLGVLATVALRTISDRTVLTSPFNIIALGWIWWLLLESMIDKSDAFLMEPRQVIFALALMAFFMALFVIFYQQPFTRSLDRFHRRRAIAFIPRDTMAISAVILSLVILAALLLKYDSNWEVIKLVLTSGRTYGGGVFFKRGGLATGYDSVYMLLDFLGASVPSLAVLSMVSLGRERQATIGWRLAASLCALLFVLASLVCGSRAFLMLYVSGPLLMWFYWGRRLNRTLFVPVSAALILIVLGAMQFNFQNRGGIKASYGSVGEAIADTKLNPVETHRDNNLYFLTCSVTFHPDPLPFLGFKPIIYYLVNPIPRAIWANKPKGIQESAESFYTPQGAFAMGPLKFGTASISATILSNGWQWYGYLGVALWAALYGLLAGSWEAIANKYATRSKLFLLLHFSWLYWLLFGERDAFAFTQFSYPVVMVYVLAIALNLLQSRPKAIHHSRPNSARPIADDLPVAALANDPGQNRRKKPAFLLRPQPNVCFSLPAKLRKAEEVDPANGLPTVASVPVKNPGSAES